jgi:hypothetical protein
MKAVTGMRSVDVAGLAQTVDQRQGVCVVRSDNWLRAEKNLAAPSGDLRVVNFE